MTIELFNKFPREVGLYRKLVYNQRQYQDYIIKNNGVNDCYTSLYPSDFLIDKIFFDFDGKNSLEEAITLYHYFKEKKFTAIPVISGMKGFHIYLLVTPDYYTKQELTLSSYSIVYEVFEKANSLDTHVLGDIRRLVRIPNTLRPPENKTWCSYLPPYFDELSPTEIFSYQKAPHNFKYKINKIPCLTDLISDNIVVPEDQNNVEINHTKHIHKDILNYVRPCLVKLITLPNAPHTARLAVTIDLINAGFSDYQMLNLYRRLGWNDFDPEITLSYIKAIRKRNYHPYSCKKLRLLGICQYECIKKKEVVV